MLSSLNIPIYDIKHRKAMRKGDQINTVIDIAAVRAAAFLFAYSYNGAACCKLRRFGYFF